MLTGWRRKKSETYKHVTKLATRQAMLHSMQILQSLITSHSAIPFPMTLNDLERH